MKFRKKEITVFALSLLVLLVIVVVVFFSRDTEVLENDTNGKSEVFLGEDVRDIQGNIYSTVQVGNQVWMAENLRTVPSVGESWCYSNEEFHCERYGRLYSWQAAMNGDQEAGSQGVCPRGWRIPTDLDWYELENFFSTGRCDSSRLDWGCFPSGKLMKTENWGGNDENLFAVLPAGLIDLEGKSSFLMSYSYFWTSTKIGDGVWRRGFLDSQDNILRNTTNPEYGYSVRCVKN